MPLKRAFGVHVVSALLTVLLVIILVNVPWAITFKGTLGEYLASIRYDLTELVFEFAEHWLVNSFILLLVVLAIEAAVIVLAVLIAPWGARDEPMRTSLTHSLRTVWIQSAHAMAIVLLVGGVGAPLDTMGRVWQASYDVPQPEMPEFPGQLKVGSPEELAYQKALDDYYAEYSKWLGAQYDVMPWYLRNRQVLIVVASLLAALWALWAVLRAVGAPRNPGVRGRPPMCEWCGYNLTSMAMEARCPECGQSVASSLGSDVRSGTAWQRRRDIGRVRAWWRCSAEAFSRPSRFGRRLRVTPPDAGHRRFFAMHLPFAFLIALAHVSLVAWYFASPTEVAAGEFLWEVLIGALMSGGGATAAMVAIALACACLAGLSSWLTERRNLLASSMQAACYLATYLTVWTAFAFADMAMIIILQAERFLPTVADAIGVNNDLFNGAIWLVPNVALLIGYLILIGRITRSTRYSNT